MLANVKTETGMCTNHRQTRLLASKYPPSRNKIRKALSLNKRILYSGFMISYRYYTKKTKGEYFAKTYIDWKRFFNRKLFRTLLLCPELVAK